MIDAQAILDITAIGISLYSLIQVFKQRLETKDFVRDALEGISSQAKDIAVLHKDLDELRDSIPKEIFAPGLEPGVYLPKEAKNPEDPVDYVKAMDLNSWKDLVSKGSINGESS